MALVGSILVGVFYTFGRAFLPLAFFSMFPPAEAKAIGAALASMIIYILMAGVLVWRPEGLFPADA